MTINAFSKEDFFTLDSISIRKFGDTLHHVSMENVFKGWSEVEKDGASAAAEFFTKEVKRDVHI